MSSGTDVVISTELVQAQITSSGVDVTLISGKLTETIIGLPGPMGSPGADGVDGADGVQGIQGPPGQDGADGVDGADGADGGGIPLGGSIGQIPVKQSATDLDINWSLNFKLDPVTGWVGAGTDSPQAPLHAKGENNGLVLENSRNGGGSTRFTIAAGAPGNYDGQLIFSTGDDISVAANHIVRLTTSGFGIPDGNSVRSDGSGALAFYKPFQGSRAEIAFRGPVNSDGQFRISGSYHNGGFNGQEVMYLRATSSGPKIGIGKTNPSTSLDVNGPVRVQSYTVATVPSAAGTGAGAMIFVTDEAGGAVMAFSDGSNWRRVTDRTVVS